MTESNSSERIAPNAADGGSRDAHEADNEVGDADARWVALIVLGDRQAFAEMFRAYAERLAAYAYSLVASTEVAEEVVQDVFFGIWQRHQQWIVRGTLKQYLYGSVRNRALDALKARRARDRLAARAAREDLSDLSPALAQPPGVALESTEIATSVREAIESLPEQQQAVIRLRWIDRLSHGEIAAVLGISVKTSENHANRAMRRLRELLAPLRP